jgi:hypothetical protein
MPCLRFHRTIGAGTSREWLGVHVRCEMCTKSYHDELKQDWERFEDATQAGVIKQSAGIFWESRHCRRCRCALAHPRDLARYGIHVSLR